MHGAENYNIYCFFITKNRPIRQQTVPYLGHLSDRSTGKIFDEQKAPGAAKGYGSVHI